MTEMTARSQSGPKPVRIRPPDKGGSDDLVLLYISTGSKTPKILVKSLANSRSRSHNRIPKLWPNRSRARARDTIIKLCLRAQRSRALARNHIIHIIQYHTNHIVPYIPYIPYSIYPDSDRKPSQKTFLRISQKGYLSKLRYSSPSTIDRPLVATLLEPSFLRYLSPFLR